MSGRPINKDREMAIFLGEKTYVGSAHSKCGTTERYVSGGGCVHCARVIATEQRDARKYLQTHAVEEAEQKIRNGDGVELDSMPEDGLDADDAEVRSRAEADARVQASIDELM